MFILNSSAPLYFNISIIVIRKWTTSVPLFIGFDALTTFYDKTLLSLFLPGFKYHSEELNKISALFIPPIESKQNENNDDLN